VNAEQPPPTTPTTTAMPIVQFADPVLRRGLSVVVWLMAAAVAGIAALAFWTSFEAILDFATRHGESDYGWRVPLLVDTFVLVATLADLWCAATRTGRESKGQRVVLWWPKLLLGAAVACSFAFNVGHAKPDLGNRAVAAMPPVALVTSFELLLFITRRAITARVARLHVATTTSDQTAIAATIRTTGDQATTPPMVAATSDQPALPTTGDQAPTTTADRATNDRTARATRTAEQATARPATSAHARGATYQRVRELYQGGMTVAAQIARELGLSASYAQRTLRQVKADLARQATTTVGGDGRATTTGERADQTSDDREDQPAARSHDHDRPTSTVAGDHDHQATSPPEATSRPEAGRDGDGRTSIGGDRHLVLVAPDHDPDRGEGRP
jgi:Protein of unknown function (DUF2637)